MCKRAFRFLDTVFKLGLIYFPSSAYPKLLVPNQVHVLCLCKNCVEPCFKCWKFGRLFCT